MANAVSKCPNRLEFVLKQERKHELMEQDREREKMKSIYHHQHCH